MKAFSKILALLLVVVMIASLAAACGNKKTDEPTAADQKTDAAVNGSKQTWGELTVFVPDTMNLKGGDGAYDPDDPKTLWLYDNEVSTKYIKLTLVKSEADAKNSVDTTKSINEKYDPEDVKLDVEGKEWNGVAYTAVGIDCSSLYTVVGEKIYFLMIGGYRYDSELVKAILASLK